jgi:hypothetical protein
MRKRLGAAGMAGVVRRMAGMLEVGLRGLVDPEGVGSAARAVDLEVRTEA